jgi:hypothetical protein
MSLSCCAWLMSHIYFCYLLILLVYCMMHEYSFIFSFYFRFDIFQFWNGLQFRLLVWQQLVLPLDYVIFGRTSCPGVLKLLVWLLRGWGDVRRCLFRNVHCTCHKFILTRNKLYKILIIFINTICGSKSLFYP